jgi:hypothetical protein
METRSGARTHDPRFALRKDLNYIQSGMTIANLPLCDGCGQMASPEHIARRLKRLEWTTHYRPIHIHTLLLGAVSPEPDAAFLYSPGAEFEGEAGTMLDLAGIPAVGKTADALHAEFQRRGFFLTHVLECPLDHGANSNVTLPELLAKRAPVVAARIRRSLKPKRVVLISEKLVALANQGTTGDLGCQMVLDHSMPFGLDGANRERAIASLRQELADALPVTRPARLSALP